MASSRYDAGSASIVSVMSVVNVEGEIIFYQSNSIPAVKYLDNLIV